MQSHVLILQTQLSQDPNPRGLKAAILQRMKDIQNLAFWKTTAQPHQLLQNYWRSNVHSDNTLKLHLQSKIASKTTEVQLQLMSGVAEMHGLPVMLDKKTGVDNVVGKPTTAAHRKNKSLDMGQFSPEVALALAADLSAMPLANYQYFSPNSSKTHQTQQYLKNLRREQQKFKQQINKKKQHILQAKSQKMQQQLSHQHILKQQTRRKKQKEMMDKIVMMKQEREKRGEDIKRFKQFYREYKSQKPLHVLMEEEFKEKIELPMIEERKNRMLLRPHNKKPTLEELNEHQQRYMEMKQNHNRTLTISHGLSVPYRSKFYKQISQSFHQSIDLGQYQSQPAQKLAKIQKYGQYVNQNLKPRVDPQKRRQIQQRIKLSLMDYPLSALSQRQQDTIVKAEHIRDRKYTLEVGNRYLQYVHRKVKKSRVNQSQSVEMSQQQKSQESEEKPQARTNYLEEQKRRHANMRSAMESWEKDMQNPNLTDYDKRQRVLLKSKLIEENALRKEKNLVNNDAESHAEKIQKKKEIDDALLEAIKAKMAVLKGE